MPFVGMGPIEFGMTPDAVAQIIGAPLRSRQRGENLRETRAVEVPIIRFIGGEVSEIEAFYDVKNVHLGDINFFEDNGLDVMRKLEALNRIAEINVGIVLFRSVGLTAGRLDEAVTGEHSVTAFRKGLWDNDKDFKPISFR